MQHSLKKNTALDSNQSRVEETINESEFFFVNKIEEHTIEFVDSLGNSFICLVNFKDYDYNKNLPYIVTTTVKDNIPHFILETIKVSEKEYQSICLYQRDQIIVSEMNLEEKMNFLLSQLNKLLNLNKSGISKEYQNEFLYYWNNSIKYDFSVETHFSCGNKLKELLYYKRNGRTRVVCKNTKLNEISLNNWKKIKSNALYVPIIDTSGILPPKRGQLWNVENILNILENPFYDRISQDTYLSLINREIRCKKIDIYFGFPFYDREIMFGCRVTFKNAGVRKFIEKIRMDTLNIESFFIKRQDIQYLNESIGNQVIRRNVGIMGIGSLGSYLTEELANAGVNRFVLFDEDKLKPENILRHRLCLGAQETNKAIAMKTILELKHPEIIVESVPENLTVNNIKDYIKKFALDYLVISVGSTDVMNDISKVLSEENLNLIVIYVWLSGNGKDSYAILINSQNHGCFHCGKKLLDISFQQETYDDQLSNIINDGCGGTRIGYGNRTLLTAANSLLNTFEKSLVIDKSFVTKSNINEGITEVGYLEKKGCEYCNGNKYAT